MALADMDIGVNRYEKPFIQQWARWFIALRKAATNLKNMYRVIAIWHHADELVSVGQLGSLLHIFC